MAMVKNRSTGSRIFNVCNIAFFALVMIVCILPVWHVFCASFSNASWVMNQRGLIWHIEGFTFNGYQLVFNDNSIWTGYLNTFIYVIGTTVLGMFLTVMAAYALSRKDFIWANPLMLIISFTMLFSGGIVTLYPDPEHVRQPLGADPAQLHERLLFDSGAHRHAKRAGKPGGIGHAGRRRTVYHSVPDYASLD